MNIKKFYFAFRKKMWPFELLLFRLLVFIFPRSAYANHKVFSLMFNLDFHNNDLNAPKKWEYYLERSLQINPEYIIDYRRALYGKYWRTYDLEKVENFMQRYIDTQEKYIQKHQLDRLHVRFSTSTIFDTYHLHCYLDTHMKAMILGLKPMNSLFFIFSENQKIGNPVMLGYWKKYITVIDDQETIKTFSPFRKYLEDDLDYTCSINGRAVYIEYAKGIVQREWEKQGRKPLFELSNEDNDFGWNQLSKLGVPKGAWFVSLHVRDAGFKMGSHLAKDDSDSYRNADIDTYAPAIKSIIARGGYVIRVGDPKMKNTAPMPGLIDYAHSDIRSMRMDVFLFSQCRFFVGVSSTPILYPVLFGVPALMTNFMPVSGRPHADNCLFLPKLLWHKDDQRYLTFSEILSTELGNMFTSHGYTDRGIDIIDNSPEELNEIVIEMMDRLDRKLSYSNEDNNIQERLNQLYRKYSGYGDLGRLGKAFAQRYSETGLI